VQKFIEEDVKIILIRKNRKMNWRNRLKKENENKQLVRISNRQINCLRWSPNETYEHAERKLSICYWLKKHHFKFITEAIFNDGVRADILDLSRSIVFEVMKTENLTKALKKLNTYPKQLEIRFIDSNKPFKEKELE